MPLTRTRSQARIDFPAVKNLRPTRSKANLKTVDEENFQQVQSTRKRQIKEEKPTPPPVVPEKRRRNKIIADENSPATESPVKLAAKSQPTPLTPKHNTQTPLKKNQTPLKNNQTPLKDSQTPLKEHDAQKQQTPKRAALTPKTMTPQRNPLTPRRDNLPSPSPLTVLRSPGKENGARALDFSPRSERSATPLKDIPVTKGRSLNFDAPVRTSPRKAFGTPRPKFPGMVSPLRLARQEGVCYQRAKQALNTAMPDRLLCREKELATVNNFLTNHLVAKKPGSLYISGAPGTGKTAVLTHTMATLRRQRHPLIYINCMSLRNSQAIYNSILSSLKGTEMNLPAKLAQSELEKSFSAKGEFVVLVLDEMDQLDSKNQEILYTMFEWPSLAKSRLVLIGIANALDLTDRILPRLQAQPTCRPQLLNFPPYSRDQIVQVLQERLKEVEVDGQAVLEMSALKFCASKVAAIAGDMRKALDVCRRAVELVEADVRKQQILNISLCRSPTKRPPTIKKIGVPHILKIVNEVYGSRMVVQSGKAQTIPLQQKLAICSLLLMSKTGKSKQIPAGKLHETYNKVCLKQNVAKVDQAEFLSMCSLIEARGILTMKKSKDARSSKVSLKLDEGELEAALQDKTLISSVLSKGL